jgi:hypothetical protein
VKNRHQTRQIESQRRAVLAELDEIAALDTMDSRSAVDARDVPTDAGAT